MKKLENEELKLAVLKNWKKHEERLQSVAEGISNLYGNFLLIPYCDENAIIHQARWSVKLKKFIEILVPVYKGKSQEEAEFRYIDLL